MTTESLDEIRQRLLCEESVQQMIRARAYEIYQMRGAHSGGSAQDWFQAEGEVLAFLIAGESRRQDEKEAAEAAGVEPSSNIQLKTPAPKKQKSRAAANAKRAAPKSAKPATSKKSARSPHKLNRRRKQLGTEESA